MNNTFSRRNIILVAILLVLLLLLVPLIKKRVIQVSTSEAFPAGYGQAQALGKIDVTDWSPDGTRLLGHNKDASGVFQVYTWDTNGGDEQMISVPAGVPGLSAGCHKGFAHYGPGGEYIVLSVEMNFLCPKQNSAPGLASSTNLWVVHLRTNTWTNLTNYPLPQQVTDLNGALSPYFSPDGTKIVWAKILEKADYSNPRMIFGKWEVHVADFSLDGGPHITNDTVLALGDGNIYETHGFSPDGGKILFSADIGLEYSAGLDLWEYNLTTRELTNLTNSPREYDEHARYSRDGQSIIWGSTKCCRSYNVQWFLGTLRSEAYTKRLDNLAEQTQLTRFNMEGLFIRKTERTGNWTTAWSPDGKSIIVAQQTYSDGIKWKSWKITLPDDSSLR